MERRVWLFAVVGFAGALAMYKTSSNHASFADNGRLNRLARLEALMDEGKTQYRSSFFRKKVQAHIIEEQVAGLDPKPSSEVKAPTSDEAAKKKAEADKKAAEEKKKADEKKKKEDAKKKKKKKKDGAKGGGNDATPDKSGDDSDKKPADPSANGGGMGGAGGGVVTNGAFNANQNPQSVQDWLNYLLLNPSFEKTSKFIQLKQIGTVTDDVFYPVIEGMLAMNNDTVRGYAVMALGATPSLTSFEALFAVNSDATFADEVKTQATHYLQVYRRIEYIQILAAAAAVQNDVALNEFAIGQIGASLSINLNHGTSPSATSTTGSSTGTGAGPGAAGTGTQLTSTRIPASNTAKRYEAVAVALHNIATTATDPGVRQAAATVASQIESRVQQFAMN